MDITLQRILSLIPKTENGKYVHGAKKEFAVNIGYGNGDIFTHWEKGKSHSYMNKLYEIAANHDVSVEWLRGETDIKNPAPSGSGNEKLDELLKLAGDLTPEQFERLLSYGQGMLDADKSAK